MNPSLKKYHEKIRCAFPARRFSSHEDAEEESNETKTDGGPKAVTVYNQITNEATVMCASGTEHPKGGNSIAFRTEKGNDNANAAAVALIEGVIGAGKLKRKTRLPRGDAKNWHKTVTEQSCFFDVFDKSGGQVIFYEGERDVEELKGLDVIDTTPASAPKRVFQVREVQTPTKPTSVVMTATMTKSGSGGTPLWRVSWTKKGGELLEHNREAFEKFLQHDNIKKALPDPKKDTELRVNVPPAPADRWGRADVVKAPWLAKALKFYTFVEVKRG